MKKQLLVTAGALALALPAGAAAQVDEIVVTATKREQTLQEVPVAVSVVQEDTIENAQIIDVFDLQTVVPSLRVSQNQSSTNTTFSIRGFGNGGNNLGIEPSVGVFIDGVYRSRSVSAISDLVDIERVEVLRGPQSTLFGKNASAGVISIVTQSPQFDWGGKLEGTIGNYNQTIVKGYVTGPILGDSLAFSLSGTMNRRDGFAENLFNGDDLNDRDRSSVRGQLLFEPTDNFSARVIADYDLLEEACCYAGNLVSGPTEAIIRGIGGDLTTGDFYAREASYDITPVNDNENRGISGQLDFDLGNAQLTSITAYRERRGKENIDGDFTSAEILGENSTVSLSDTFTQEVRLSGETERLGWLIGGFYFDETVEANSYLGVGADFRGFADGLAGGQLLTTEAALIAGGLLPPGTEFFGDGQAFNSLFTQENESYSIFGQADFDVTDRLTLTAGLAYTKDEKDVELNSFNNEPFSAIDFDVVGPQVVFAQVFATATGQQATPTNVAAFAAANPTAFAGIQAAAAAQPNPFLPFQPLQFLPQSLDYPNSVESGSTSDDDVTYTLRAAYDVTDRTNIYASYATGFKATSFNLTRDSRPFASDQAAIEAAGLDQPNQSYGTRFAGPEETEVFELGLKSRFDWGALNVAVFDQTIEGFQSTVFQGTGFVLANAGEQSVRGAEVELLLQPTERLTINAAGTYLDPEYDSFVGAAGPNGPVDLSGETPSGISEWSHSLAATYTHPVEGGDLFARGEWAYESSTPTADNLPDFLPEREVNVFNASLGANLENGVDVLLWGRNLFDDEYLIVGFPTTAQAGSYNGYPNAPRTYGFTLRLNY